MLGKIEGRRRRGRQRMRWLDGITNSMDKGFGWTLGVGDGQEGLVCCGSWGHKESDMTEQLNWTELSGFLFLRTKEPWIKWRWLKYAWSIFSWLNSEHCKGKYCQCHYQNYPKLQDCIFFFLFLNSTISVGSSRGDQGTGLSRNR